MYQQMISVVALLTLACPSFADPPKYLSPALKYIAAAHDVHHRSFGIWRDADSAGNHFYPSGWMGDFVVPPGAPRPAWVRQVIEPRCMIAAEGVTSMQFVYPKELIKPTSKRWAAIAFEGPPIPSPMAGMPDKIRSYDLSRYFDPRDEPPQLVCRAQSVSPGAQIQFKFLSKEEEVLPSHLTTAREWGTYNRALSPMEVQLRRDSMFTWVADANQNPNGCTFRIDDVRIEFGPNGTSRRLKEPRFVASFVTIGVPFPDQYFREGAFLYDQAIATSALVSTGRREDLERAQLIADAIVYCSTYDRFYTDGRLRNVYRAGDLAEIGKEGPTGSPNMFGWWDYDKQKWFESKYAVSTDTGNTAWAALALLNVWDAQGGPKESPYLATAISLGKWIDSNCFSTTGPGGFTGGFEGWEPTRGRPEPAKSTWKSTEHAIDCYALFHRLHEITGQDRFKELRDHADRFIEAMWSEDRSHLVTGTKEDGVTPNLSPQPLDPQTWGYLAFMDGDRFSPAIDWALENCVVESKGVSGLDFDTDRDGIWWEGTAQMVLALRGLGRDDESKEFSQAIRKRGMVTKGVGVGAVFATSTESLTTGFSKVWDEKPEPWLYFRRPHLGATAWWIMGEMRYNPLTGKRL